MQAYHVQVDFRAVIGVPDVPKGSQRDGPFDDRLASLCDVADVPGTQPCAVLQSAINTALLVC